VYACFICILVCILPVAAAPAVISVDPLNGATGVLGNPTITVTFDNWISDGSSDPLTGTITITDGTNNIDFGYSYAFGTKLQFGKYAGPWLAPNTAYTVTIAGFKDLDGDPMPSPYSWKFTTGADTSPPTVISTYPADKAIKVPVDVNAITIKFSEDIIYNPEGWKAIKLQTYNDEYPHYVDYDFGQITVTGDILSINAPETMTPWFENWKFYFVTVEGVYDTAGNEMVYQDLGYNPPIYVNDYGFYFQTVSTDITLPSVTSTYPADGSSNVPTDVTITVVMSESINRCVGTVTLVDSNNNPVALLYGDQYFTADDYKNLEIKPVSPLVKGETYTVTMQGLIDSHYNVMEPYSWSFTVGTQPVADAGPDQTVIVNENMQFDGSASTDPDGVIVSYAWDFGDTQTGTGAVINHAYTTTGLKTVTLTVTDNDGLTGTDTAMITVKTPGDTVQDLSIKVDGMGLPSDIESGLMAKLAAAKLQITKKQYTAAQQTLLAFINQVKSQQGKTLTKAQADELIAIAQRIRNSIPKK
jgi:methionine-rich copper-binding protein CopC